MKRNRAAMAAILLAAAPLAGCETTADGRTVMSKTAFGAVAGGLAVGGLCAVAKGNASTCAALAVAGAAAGGIVGSRLDARDRARRNYALQSALRNDALWSNPGAAAPVTWNNPETGNSGVIRPIRSFVQQTRTCRTYQEELRLVHGEPVQETKTDCS